MSAATFVKNVVQPALWGGCAYVGKEFGKEAVKKLNEATVKNTLLDPITSVVAKGWTSMKDVVINPVSVKLASIHPVAPSVVAGAGLFGLAAGGLYAAYHLHLLEGHGEQENK